MRVSGQLWPFCSFTHECPLHSQGRGGGCLGGKYNKMCIWGWRKTPFVFQSTKLRPWEIKLERISLGPGNKGQLCLEGIPVMVHLRFFKRGTWIFWGDGVFYVVVVGVVAVGFVRLFEFSNTPSLQ